MAQFFGQLIGIAIASLLHAIFVRLGTKLLAKTEIRYKRAYVIALSANLASFLIGSTATMIVPNPAAAIMISLVGGFFVACIIYGTAIKRNDGDPIGIPKGTVIMLFSAAIVIVPLMLIGLLTK